MAFNKDLWVKMAIEHGVYWAKPDGSIFKRQPGSLVGRQVTPSVHKKSGRVYFTMTFLGLSKSVLVNRFVGLALIPNPKGLPEVNHKDGNKRNNAVSNLEWAGRSEQEKHAFAKGLKTVRGSANSNAKLSAMSVAAIRSSLMSDEELARQYGVAVSTIRAVRNNQTWRHVAA